MRTNLFGLSISIILAIFLFLIVKLPDNTLMDHEIQNTGHTVLFGLLTFLNLKIYRLHYPEKSQFYSYIVIFLFLAFLGISIELLQIPMQRDADIIDFLRDILGIITAIGIDYFLLIKNKNKIYPLQKKDYIILSSSLLSFIISILPIITLALAYYYRNNTFPVIINFNSIYSNYFYQTYDASIKNNGTENFSLVKFKQSKRSGFSIIEPVTNWQNYNKICFNTYSANSTNFELNFRIHDKRHNFKHTDRFNTHFIVTVHPQKKCFELSNIKKAPLNRELKLNEIDRIHLYKSNNENEVEFYISQIWLE